MKTFTLSGLVLALVILAGGWSCNQNQSSVQRAATANKDFINAVAAAQQAEIQFHDPCTSPGTPAGCGEIDDTLHIAFQRDFKTLAQCSDQAGQAFAANNTAGAQAALKACSTSVQSLITNNAAGIKNPSTKASLTALLVAIQTSVNTALAFLQ